MDSPLPYFCFGRKVRKKANSVHALLRSVHISHYTEVGKSRQQASVVREFSAYNGPRGSITLLPNYQEMKKLEFAHPVNPT